MNPNIFARLRNQILLCSPAMFSIPDNNLQSAECSTKPAGGTRAWHTAQTTSVGTAPAWSVVACLPRS